MNGLAANNFAKISLLEAFNAIHDFDVICITETFLDSDYLDGDKRLGLQGYDMIRSDHPSNTKRGGVCIYYKKYLPLVKRDDIFPLSECLVCEISMKKSKCFVTCVYHSPSQSLEEFNNFCIGFESICTNIALESPFCSFIFGDFNAKCTNWWSSGVNNLNGMELDNLSTFLGYSQLINEPTNFEPNKTPSCIDLIFASQPNLVSESGVIASLCSSCRHQITFAKTKFKVILPPTYEREVWHFNRAEINLIRRSISNFNWDKALDKLATNDQVELFTNTLLNIFRNFIPHETIKV